jgi:tetratricopeptide (TPR) repeat protein
MSKIEFIEADDYYDMACQWRKEGELEKAIECFKHAIELNKFFIYAYVDLADVYAVKRDYHAAVSVLKRAVKLDPQFDLLYYNTAKYLYRCGDLPGAVKYIEDAVELNDTELYKRVRSVILKKIIT